MTNWAQIFTELLSYAYVWDTPSENTGLWQLPNTVPLFKNLFLASLFSSHTALQSIFLTSPQSQSENIGSSVSLSCSIVSNPQASISWLFNGGDVTDDATSVSITTVDSATRSTLSISTLEHKHGGQYRCLATNRLLPSSVVYSGIASLMLIGKFRHLFHEWFGWADPMEIKFKV